MGCNNYSNIEVTINSLPIVVNKIAIPTNFFDTSITIYRGEFTKTIYINDDFGIESIEVDSLILQLLQDSHREGINECLEEVRSRFGSNIKKLSLDNSFPIGQIAEKVISQTICYDLSHRNTVFKEKYGNWKYILLNQELNTSVTHEFSFVPQMKKVFMNDFRNYRDDFESVYSFLKNFSIARKRKEYTNIQSFYNVNKRTLTPSGPIIKMFLKEAIAPYKR